MHFGSLVTAATAGLMMGSLTMAGPFSGPTQTDHPIDPAIPANSPLIVEWANNILPLGAGTYFAPRGSTSISLTGFNSLGDLSSEEIAAGQSPGFLTVTFPTGIRNGPGHDFAVFENGFAFGTPNGLFLEVAYVEVSSNGTDFARFPSISTNTTPVTGSGGFSGWDTTNIYNLAGKHANGFGTPFDLDDLINDPLVLSGEIDLNDIQFVRLVDIPGSGDFLDSLGNPIFDAWLTTGTGGFDFRLSPGVGVIHAVPEPAAAVILGLGGLLVFQRRSWGPA